ncbi:helix-turn-helix transcriptional regulator [Amycolatopsis sp. RTGN1]|uniref:helix-turn-helix transcriptional regulator n=1 Tax=Amycolatopsis ponsaeliensis TaxID=2992142 RepID=UPI00254B221A|nr:helix-turn-helix transcriptional regulator [Amycolatopsis sp. RTGN1]
MSSAYSEPTSPAGKWVSPARVTVTTKDVGKELRRLRRAAGETQAQLADIIGVSRANLTQWETGKYLPSSRNAQQLDDHFEAENALVKLAEAARAPHGNLSPVAVVSPVVDTAGSLLEVFGRVGRSLEQHLIRDERGRALGWRHNLQKDSGQTALATAYGISAMSVVGDPYIDLHSAAENLYAMRTRHGWQGRSGGRRPETTAAVIDALFQVSTLLSADDGLAHLEHSLDDFSRTRPFLLSSALRTAVRLRPDAPLTLGLVDDLLSTRLDFDGILLWPEKNERGLVAPEPSTVHTARAVVALREALRNGAERTDVREAVEQATQWLIDRTHPDDGVSEELIREKPGEPGTTRIVIRHFTSAWVVLALVDAPLVPLARLQRALGPLWARYEPSLGLWAWGSGDLPIWMTLDAVTALRAAALALVAAPVRPPGE